MRVPPLETLERAIAAVGYMIAAGLGCCVVQVLVGFCF